MESYRIITYDENGEILCETAARTQWEAEDKAKAEGRRWSWLSKVRVEVRRIVPMWN